MSTNATACGPPPSPTSFRPEHRSSMSAVDMDAIANTLRNIVGEEMKTVVQEVVTAVRSEIQTLRTVDRDLMGPDVSLHIPGFISEREQFQEDTQSDPMEKMEKKLRKSANLSDIGDNEDEVWYDTGATTKQISSRTTFQNLTCNMNQASQLISRHLQHWWTAEGVTQRLRWSLGSAVSVGRTARSGRFSIKTAVIKAVDKGYLDSITCLAVLANAIFLGVQADRGSAAVASDPGMRAVELGFCVFYIFELSCRIYTYGWKFFTNGDKWNWFDFICVTVQIIDEFCVSVIGGLKDSTHVNFDARVIRVARILRLLRIVRILRVIRFVHELKKIIFLIMGSLGSFCWTGILLLLLIYILAVFFTSTVADYSDTTRQSHHLTDPKDLQKYFGSTLGSLQVLYMAITGGFDWQEAIMPLNEHVSPWVGLVFLGYIAFAVLVVLNLVTGVFVDSAMRLCKADDKMVLLEKAYNLFKKTKENFSGSLTWEDFQDSLDSPEMIQFFEALDIDLSRASDLFQLIDIDQDGTLRLDELVAGGLMLQGPAKAIEVAAISKQLRVANDKFDDNMRWQQQLFVYLKEIHRKMEHIRPTDHLRLPSKVSITTTQRGSELESFGVGGGGGFD